MDRVNTQDQFLRDFLRLLRRQRILIVASLLVAGAAAVAYAAVKTPVYDASADIKFNDQSQDLTLLGTPVAPAAQPEVQAAADAQVITSPPVIRRVTREVHGDLSAGQVRDAVATSVDPSTNLVSIKTHADDAKLAAELANSYARQTKIVATRAERGRLIQGARRLQRTIRQQHQTPETQAINAERLSRLQSLASFATPVQFASSAGVPGNPTSPNPTRDIPLALFLGLVLGLLAAFLRDSLDRRLADAHDIQHEVQVPLVGYVEVGALGKVPFSQNGSGPSHAGMEAFRILRSNVDFLAPHEHVQTIAVTSPVAEEGKSTVAAGLASASALAGKRVLLIECDLRRPVFAERFKVASQPGLTDWLTGNAEARDVIQTVPVGGQSDAENGSFGQANLVIMVAGSWSSGPAELLGSERFRTLLGQVSQVYDLVILDCAPLLPVGDSLEVLPHADAVLACIRLDQTTREQARAAMAALNHLPARPTGAVITGVRPGRDGYYYGYYPSAAEARSVLHSAPIQK